MAAEKLNLPLFYEDAREEIRAESGDLVQLFHFLPEFEGKILSVIDEIRNAGIILFVYGVSGVGKTTFLHSLKYRSFLPIRDIREVTAFNFESATGSVPKPDALFEEIRKIAIDDAEYDDKSKKTCVIISSLEHLEGEDEGAVRKFFMNLNGLLRKYPLLILWQVNVIEDLQKMLSYAQSIATTLISRRLEYLHFTGPKQEVFPDVVRKNVSALYPGKE